MSLAALSSILPTRGSEHLPSDSQLERVHFELAQLCARPVFPRTRRILVPFLFEVQR